MRKRVIFDTEAILYPKEQVVRITPDDPFCAFVAFSYGHMTEDEAINYSKKQKKPLAKPKKI